MAVPDVGGSCNATEGVRLRAMALPNTITHQRALVAADAAVRSRFSSNLVQLGVVVADNRARDLGKRQICIRSNEKAMLSPGVARRPPGQLGDRACMSAMPTARGRPPRTLRHCDVLAQFQCVR